ncbi:FecCD family ABC transporter permease [Myroides sp. LJL116]
MQTKLTYYIIILTLTLLVLTVLCMFLGVYHFEHSIWDTIWSIVSNQQNIPVSDKYVLVDLRLPRVLTAILIGSALSICGTSLQGLFKNPLASPDLIGVTAGAVLFAAVTIVLGSYFKDFLPEIIRYSILSIMSFLGAIITMSIVYKISTDKGKTNISILLLSGVAIGAISGSITGLLTYISTDEELRNLTFWTLGSLAGATWSKVTMLTIVIVPCVGILITKGKALNAMMLGEKDAIHLGIKVEKVKKQIIILSALMVGTCVAFTGTIGFVGLIIPYILRLLFSSNYYIILPLSAISGAILVLVADTISRTLLPPSEIPIGILTSMIGAPVFIAILIRFKKSL